MEGQWLVFYDDGPFYDRHVGMDQYEDREEALKRIAEIKSLWPKATVKLYWSESEEDFS